MHRREGTNDKIRESSNYAQLQFHGGLVLFVPLQEQCAENDNKSTSENIKYTLYINNIFLYFTTLYIIKLYILRSADCFWVLAIGLESGHGLPTIGRQLPD